MKTLIRTFKQISILILAITFLGCEDDEVNLPKVVAGFTHTINTDNSVVTFINISENATNYSWDLGDGTNATLINPVKYYSAGEYKVVLTATNVAGASDTFEDIIVISDVGAPVITLLGETTMNIMIGGSYIDPGATATDDLDGDITANIVVGGDTVDVNTAGTYIVTYNVSDAAGNAATQRTRTVIVAADVVAPVITLTGSATINISLGGSFTDPGATATDDVDGDITANIVVGGDAVNVNTAGTYTITYNVTDASGNAATEVKRTVIVSDPNSCISETTESYNAANLNMTFLTDPSADFISDGAGFSWIDNPDTNNDVNKSCKVGKVVKSGQFNWDNNQYDLDAKLDFNNNTGLKIKVWSARANTEVRLKLEEIGNAGNNVEKFLTTSITSGWEELTFPFAASDSNKFNKIVIFFDLNAKNTDTYYFDDLMLYGDGASAGGGGTGGGTTGGTVTGLASNSDFETGTDSGWIRFQNGGLAVLDNTRNNGGSWSGRLETNGASNPAFKQEAIGVGAVAAGDKITIAFDHIGSMGGEGGVFNVLLFGEGANGASFTHVFNPTPALTDAWSRFSGSFTIPAGTDVSGGISFLIETVCGGAAGCTVTANIDNVSVTVN
jgi:hypothetical protein